MQGTEEGKKYWKKDPEWYVEEIQKALCLDTQMVRARSLIVLVCSVNADTSCYAHEPESRCE